MKGPVDRRSGIRYKGVQFAGDRTLALLADDSVRIAYNLESLSEMSYIAVFVPADTAEAAAWGTGGAVLMNI